MRQYLFILEDGKPESSPMTLNDLLQQTDWTDDEIQLLADMKPREIVAIESFRIQRRLDILKTDVAASRRGEVLVAELTGHDSPSVENNDAKTSK